MRTGHVVLVVAALSFITSLIWGPRSGYQWTRLRSTLSDLQNQIEMARLEQIRLSTRINELKTNPHAQLKTIRETIGFLAEDETMFEFFTNK